MTAALIIGCIIAYCVLGVVGGAALRWSDLRTADDNKVDPAVLGTLGFIIGPVVIAVLLLYIVGYMPVLLVKKGPFLLIKKGQDYLVTALQDRYEQKEPKHEQKDNDREQMPKLTSNTAPHRYPQPNR